MNAEDKDRPVGEDYRGQPRIHISVQQVAVHGKGAILLTGPSSCGKGELANSLCRFLSLPSRCQISMGDGLRETIEAARQDSATREMLREQCGISDLVSVFDERLNPADLLVKVKRYLASGNGSHGRESGVEQMTQLDWLDYCVREGLLIPDEWADRLIEARLRNTPDLNAMDPFLRP